MLVSLNIGLYYLSLFIETLWRQFDDVMDYYLVYDVNSCGGNDPLPGVYSSFYPDDRLWGRHAVFLSKL